MPVVPEMRLLQLLLILSLPRIPTKFCCWVVLDKIVSIEAGHHALCISPYDIPRKHGRLLNVEQDSD